MISDILSTLVCSLFVVASVYMAIKKELIKDTWSPEQLRRQQLLSQKDPSATPLAKPYSLARTQLFWWTLIISVCCFVSFVKTGEINFNTTALILFGVSLTTVAGGRLIDNDQIKENATLRHQDKPSEGFWTDILSDENGMSIGRFQTVVMNILFGLVFLSAFFKYIQFPDFGEWQLALLGASSSGYLAGKLNENPKPAPHDMTT